jgi:hypothetical protein
MMSLNKRSLLSERKVMNLPLYEREKPIITGEDAERFVKKALHNQQNIKITKMINNCKFCGREMQREGISYLANPFCSDCYEDRLEASESIDLRDNHMVIDLGNGYVQIEPIDSSKKFKKQQNDSNERR